MTLLPSRTQGRSRWWLSVGLVGVVVLCGGLALEGLLAKDSTYSYLRLFNEVLLLVDRNYVDETEITQLMQGAYDGLLSSLDPESEYLTREQYQRLTTPPGADDTDLGLHLSRRGGYALVVSVMPGSPAEKAGITSGTRIRRIDGVSTRELTLTEARLKLRGRPGTEVELQRVPREGEEETVRVRRESYAPPAPQVSRVRGHLVLRVPRLDAGAAAAARKALDKVAGSHGARLLIDLRGTSEGDYAEAAHLVSLFVGSGRIGRIRSRDGDEKVLAADGRSLDADLDVAVLVDHGTAGPAELVAQALRARAGAEVLGTRTFGQASIQDFIPLADGAMVRLSVARCLGPEGEGWDPDGLEPDQAIDVEEVAGTGEDDFLRRAIELLEDDEEPELQAA